MQLASFHHKLINDIHSGDHELIHDYSHSMCDGRSDYEEDNDEYCYGREGCDCEERNKYTLDEKENYIKMFKSVI